jgi:hypothetical protein
VTSTVSSSPLDLFLPVPLSVALLLPAPFAVVAGLVLPAPLAVVEGLVLPAPLELVVAQVWSVVPLGRGVSVESVESVA